MPVTCHHYPCNMPVIHYATCASLSLTLPMPTMATTSSQLHQIQSLRCLRWHMQRHSSRPTKRQATLRMGKSHIDLDMRSPQTCDSGVASVARISQCWEVGIRALRTKCMLACLLPTCWPSCLDVRPDTTTLYCGPFWTQMHLMITARGTKTSSFPSSVSRFTTWLQNINATNLPCFIDSHQMLFSRTQERRQTDRQTTPDRQTDRQTDRPDRQTTRQTYDTDRQRGQTGLRAHR